MKTSFSIPGVRTWWTRLGWRHRTALRVAMRLFWLVMALAHGPALVGGWRALFVSDFGIEALGGCLLLTASVVFFALKLLDAPFLRIRVDRRAGVALCMIVALLHLDVVRPADDPTLVPECTTIVVATWLAAGVPIVRRRLRIVLSRTSSGVRHLPSLNRMAEVVWQDVLRPHCWCLAYRIFLFRAPPA